MKKASKTHHCSGTLLKDEFATAQTGRKLALLHWDPIVVEKEVRVETSMNGGNAADSDDVVATGDGGEDARLNVHRTICSPWPVGVVKLHAYSLVVDD